MHSIPDKGYSYYGEVRLGHSSLVCVSKFYANLKKCFFVLREYVVRYYVTFRVTFFGIMLHSVFSHSRPCRLG